MAKTVSIIVLCRNRWADSRRCLESLRKSTPPDLYELLVYDNASSDETLSNLRRMAKGWPQLRVLHNDRNFSFSEGVNHGMRAAAGRHFVWLNNDTVLAPGWLEGLLKAVGADGIGAAGPMTDHKAPPRQVCAPFITRNPSRTLEAPFLGGFCFLLKRSAVERAGYLDERFVWGWEDMDYCMRLRQSGLRLLLARDVFVRHAGSRTLQDMASNERQRTDIDNRRLMIQKWMREGPWKKDLHELYQELPAPWHQLTPKTSILVVCRGDGGHARDCLESVRRAMETRDYEVLAVDAGNGGRVFPWLEKLGRSWPELKVLGPWGHAQAASLNAAAAHAQGNYLAVLDDQTLVEPGWLKNLLKITEIRPDAGAVKAGTAFLTPRKTFERVGGFDERFSGALYAADYFIRVLRAGYSVLEDGAARVHLSPDRTEEPAEVTLGDRRLAVNKWLASSFDFPGLSDIFWREMGPKPALSLILLCRGNWTATHRRLMAVRRAVGKKDYEVLAAFMDPDAATKSRIIVLSRQWPALRALGPWGDRTPAPALNRAAAMAQADAVSFLDEESLAKPNWLKHALRTAQPRPDAGADKAEWDPPPSVSIVVICRGKWKGSQRCLSTLRRAIGKVDCEILAGCFEAEAKTSVELEKLAKTWPRLRFLGKWEPTPYAHVLNLAQISARGEFILFLSDDVLLAPGCVEALVRKAKKNAAGVIAPRCANSRSVDSVKDYCLLIAKTVFSSLGGFDNRFQKTLWAEDFCFRAKQKGYEVLVADKALVQNVPRRDCASLAHDRNLIFGKWSGHPLFKWR